jgi:hypothetical protein
LTGAVFIRAARALSCLGLALVVIAGAGCTALGLYPRERAFTAAEVQERVARRFPFRRSFSIVDVELTNPIVRLDGARNRVAIAFDAGVRSPFLGNVVNGRATLSGVPRYAATDRTFLLGDLALDALDVPGMPARVADEVRRIAGGIAREALDGVPIYTLRPEDGRMFGQDLEPESVSVEGERLVLRVRPRGSAEAKKVP